jgi:hypothetical protein
MRTTFLTTNRPVIVSRSGLPLWNATSRCVTSARKVPGECATTSAATIAKLPPASGATPSSTLNVPSAAPNQCAGSNGGVRATSSPTG